MGQAAGMDAPLDRYRANREALIALAPRQREPLAEQEQRRARQAAELATQQAAIVHLSH